MSTSPNSGRRRLDGPIRRRPAAGAGLSSFNGQPRPVARPADSAESQPHLEPVADPRPPRAAGGSFRPGLTPTAKGPGTSGVDLTARSPHSRSSVEPAAMQTSSTTPDETQAYPALASAHPGTWRPAAFAIAGAKDYTASMQPSQDAQEPKLPQDNSDFTLPSASRDNTYTTNNEQPSALPPIGAPRQVAGQAAHHRRPVKRLVGAVMGVAVVLGMGWFGYKAVNAAHNIIKASNGGAPALASAVDITKLKGEGDGRVNILVLGVGGAGHEGPNLSDTIMVWSLDPKTKDVAMLSVPRDLYVQIPASTKNKLQYNKINAANALGGPLEAEKVVEKVIGVPIHYYVVVDFSGFKQAIDAVGGVDIDVPTALFDKTYPCETGNKYCPYTQPAGHVHMTGLQALRYSRCRHNEAGVGNCGNDYGRAARQQQVIAALRQKALSAGTLTNPVKLSGLIDAIGDHATTDLQISEISKLAAIAKDINPAHIVNKVLDDAPDSFLTGGVNLIPGAGYIYLPRAGAFVYDDIQDFVKNLFVDHYITDENARLEVQNGSGITGLAAKVSASLKLAHYNVADPSNAPITATQTVIYDYTNGQKPYTIKYLETRFGVTAQKATAPASSPTPVSTSGASVGASPSPVPAIQIRIILGSNYQTPTASPTDATTAR